MIDNDIRILLEAPAAGEGAPTLAHIEDALTAGYGRAMALEAEHRRLERRIADLAAKLTGDEADLRSRSPELRRLGRKLAATDADLARLRGLLESLRVRAAVVRAA